jgi:stage II sporulation protein D
MAAADVRWTRVLAAKDVERRLHGMGFKGLLLALNPGRRGASGRLLALSAVGKKGSLTLDAAGMEQALSPGALRSTFFTVKTLRRRGKPVYFLLFGAGTGDGHGLCRAGADGLASSGSDYKSILLHYVPGATVTRGGS